MEIYLYGCVIALALEVIALFRSIQNASSIRVKNLKHVGIFYSIIRGGTFTKENRPGFLGNTFHILWSLLITPLFSWVSVTCWLYQFHNSLFQSIATPQRIKEIQYKLGDRLLTRQEVKNLLKEEASFRGLTDYYGVLDRESRTLVLSDVDGYSEIILYIDENRYEEYCHTSDYMDERNSIYEYKIEGTRVRQRLLEEKITHPGEQYYDVKDGIMLEDEIVARNQSNYRLSRLNDKLDDLKKRLEWHDITEVFGGALYYKVVHFVLSEHPGVMSEQDLKGFLKSELERINLGLLKFNELCKKYGLLCKESEYGYLQIDGITEENDEEIDKALANLEATTNCTKKEIYNSKGIISTLNRYIK